MANTAAVEDINIGKPDNRVDGRLKVTGAARYSAEMPVANIAYAVMIMSTVPSATLASMDVGDAQKSAGVLTVLTPFNTPPVQANHAAGAGAQPVRQPGRNLALLQDTNVHYSNQPIGVVVAQTLEQARYAASLVKVAYETQAAATHFNQQRDNAYSPGPYADSTRGDAASTYASADHKLRQVYATPVENHNPMEPHATIASWDGSDHLTVFDSTQGIFGVRGVLAGIFGLPPENVRCITHFVGGGFGCKGQVWSHCGLAAIAALQVGRPVKLVVDRAQMYGPVGYRPQTEQTISLSSDAAGKLTSIQHDTLTHTSTFDDFLAPSGVVSQMLYACDNVSVTHNMIRLNYGTPTYTRAPAQTPGTYALESAMDELAFQLGMDPIALRLANYAETDQSENKPFSSKSLRDCYIVGAQRFGWNKRNPAPRSMRTQDGLLLGMGMATCVYPAHRGGASALARIMADGSGWAGAGTQDIGTGTYTVMTQVAADALGLPVTRVRFDLGDTSLPQTPGSGGSTTAASTAPAVWAAGMAARVKAIQMAIADSGSALYGLSADDIEVNDGQMISKSAPSKSENYAALLRRNKLPYLEAAGRAGPDEATGRFSSYSFGAVFTEVHVDPDLGIVRVARATGRYGIGRLLNAKTGRSQFIGGIVWGIGMALTEQTLADPTIGRVVNNDLAEYHIPVNADIPEIDVSVADEVDPYINSLGIKGIGEIGITGVAAAIANAVFHATGKRVRDLPITMDKLIQG